MFDFDRKLLRFFLPGLLAKASGESVHRSGIEGAKTNSFVTTIRQDGKPAFVLIGLDDLTISALQFDGRRYAIPVKLSLDEINPSGITVTHFYGLDELRFASLRSLALARLTGWPYAIINLRRLFDSIFQYIFNRRTLILRRRLELLRDVVNATSGDRDWIGSLDLMSMVYGKWWAEHPDWRAHDGALERQLDLLVESGELTKNSSRYRPTGKAMETLERSDDEDRRHTANLRVQWMLAALTLVSAVMAAAQAGLIKLPTLIDLSGQAQEAVRAASAQQTGFTASPKQQHGCSCVISTKPERVGADSVPLGDVRSTVKK